MKPFLVLILLSKACLAGPYASTPGTAGSDAIHRTDETFSFWANDVVIERGPVDIAFPEGALASFGSDTDALDQADADADLLDTFSVVSLGDGGLATLTFAQAIVDGPGPDLAVFENSFNDAFLELAFVSVSSDGIHFARFPAISLTPTSSQISTFGTIDPTNIHNLAGKYRAGYGTPFNLNEITDPLVNTAAITHVRIEDVVGSISPSSGTVDRTGNLINDPYPTVFTSGGFDLDAVGSLQQTPGTFNEWTQFYFGSTGYSFIGDNNNNHLADGLEWALWCDPNKNPTPLKFDVTPTGAHLSFSFDPSRLPTTMIIEGSSNLTGWTSIAELQGSSIVAVESGWTLTNNGMSPARVSLNSTTSPLRYFRCKATE